MAMAITRLHEKPPKFIFPMVCEVEAGLSSAYAAIFSGI
jgi:hypothetical protein